jgi:hypothetical protein
MSMTTIAMAKNTLRRVKLPNMVTKMKHREQRVDQH